MNLEVESLYAEARLSEMRQGKQLFYENKVSDLRLGGIEANKPLVTGNCSEDKKGYSVVISFDEQGGFYECSCTCNASLTDGACRHIVAVALSSEAKFAGTFGEAQDGVGGDSSRPRTDTIVYQLASELARKRISARYDTTLKKVSLIPVLMLDGDAKLHLRVNIARNRSYVVKSIADFLRALDTGSRRRFGQDLELQVIREVFDEHSSKLIDFIFEASKENNYRNKTKSENIRSDIINLLPGDLDEFFAINEGRLIEYEAAQIKQGMRRLELGVDTLKANVFIESGDGGFYITTDFPAGRLLNGKKYDYYITQTRIYRLSNKFSAKIVYIAETLLKSGRTFVLKSDMPLAYNNVMLAVEPELNIVAPNIDLSKYVTPPLDAKLFVGLSGTGELVATLDTSYDSEHINVFNSEFAGEMVRDIESEKMLVSVLEEFFPNSPNLTLSSDRDIYHFLKEGLHTIAPHANIVLDAKVKAIKIKKPPSVKIGVRLSLGLLELDLINSDYTSKQMYDMVSASGEHGFIRLADGSFVDLTDSALNSLSDFFIVAGRDAKENSQLPISYLPFLHDEFANDFDGQIDFDALSLDLIKKLKAPLKNKKVEVKGIKGELREYQKEGLAWLKARADLGLGGILADEMGLGKSLQVIALFSLLAKDKCIIVCPTSLILNWVAEFKKFAPQIKTVPIYGTAQERLATIFETQKAKGDAVLITSYELLKRDEELYKDYNFNFAILDEAQYIKNPTTYNSRSVKSLKAKYRFALTGTPIENSLSELWSIFDFIIPGFLSNYANFKLAYETAIIEGSEVQTNRFKALVAPFILRRLKTDVLKELPDKIETTISAPLEGEQKTLYMSHILQAKKELHEMGGSIQNHIAFLALLMKVRQIACDPRLILPSYDGNSAKFEACIDLVKMNIEGGHKVLLFSQFTSMIDLFKDRFIKEGITHYILKGDTKKSKRMDMVNSFNTDETQVFLISLKAGGTGLNLTGADTVIHYDPWWNESVTSQATDRAHRMGQKKSVRVYRMVVENTVEEKMQELSKRKNALSKLILEGSAEKLSLDDMIELLG